MLAILLNKSGVVSDMAEDGQEAVDMIRKDLDYYRMIFMDNMMPHMVSDMSKIRVFLL